MANIAGPTLGLVDTAVLGHGGAVADLGAIAYGALVFTFVYWSFGFLRMGTTGFVAQAEGKGDSAEIRAAFARAGILGAAVGVFLMALSSPIQDAAFALLDASAEIQDRASPYIATRLWGAPAALISMAITGTLIGTGQTRAILIIQLVMNGLNIALDLLFAGLWGWGTYGVALGTVISEWVSVVIGLVLLIRILRARHRDAEPFFPLARLRNVALLFNTLIAHRDILIRTVFMLLAFAWFTKAGARYGDETLAANHILLQFISFAAFFLDGIAFALESLIGAAAGARDLTRFDAILRRANILALGIAVGLALLLLIIGDYAVMALTDLPGVRALASAIIHWPALYIAVAVWAFQFDGVFIGLTRTAEMRNASIASVAIFWVLAQFLMPAYQNDGLWLAMIGYATIRGLTLFAYLPRIRADLAAMSQGPIDN